MSQHHRSDPAVRADALVYPPDNDQFLQDHATIMDQRDLP
jgi:hypothetical protein